MVALLLCLQTSCRPSVDECDFDFGQEKTRGCVLPHVAPGYQSVTSEWLVIQGYLLGVHAEGFLGVGYAHFRSIKYGKI